MSLKLGIVGFGKIARDEHVPAIARTPDADLIAVASPHGRHPDLPIYPTLTAMLAAHPDLDAIVLAQPPVARFAAAHEALAAGKHVFLEKPPGATLSEVDQLCALARQRGLTLFAGWHARWSGQVAALKAWVAGRTLRQITIEWKEDVRLWHPGQDWIWQPGGFGVMDPGINALSILTGVVADPIRLVDATLAIPGNRHTPIAATLALMTASGVPVSVALDWLQTGPQIWRMEFTDSSGECHVFAQGGDNAEHTRGDAESALAPEYRAMFAHFVALVKSARSDVDVAPLQIVADAFLRGKIDFVAPFEH